MPSKVRIALDAMGGDAGAAVVIPGAAISLQRHRDTEFLLVGDRAKIEPELDRHPQLKAASKVERARRASGPSVGWPSLAHTAVQRSSGACGPSACCPRASWRRRQSRSSSGAFGPR